MTHRRIRRYIKANQNFQDIDVRTILNDTRKGKLNNVGEITLTKDSTSTSISDDLITTISAIFFTAKTAEAAAKLNTIWYSSTSEGVMVLNHASTSTSTVMYDFCVFN